MLVVKALSIIVGVVKMPDLVDWDDRGVPSLVTECVQDKQPMLNDQFLILSRKTFSFVFVNDEYVIHDHAILLMSPIQSTLRSKTFLLRATNILDYINFIFICSPYLSCHKEYSRWLCQKLQNRNSSEKEAQIVKEEKDFLCRKFFERYNSRYDDLVIDKRIT